jgi:hypothetical protein
LKGGTHSYKFAADQGDAAAQFNYRNCLRDNKDVSAKLKRFRSLAHVGIGRCSDHTPLTKLSNDSITTDQSIRLTF